MSRRVGLIVGLLVAVCAAGLSGNAALSAKEKPKEPAVAKGLEVHEWGTFTTVAGGDGAVLEWRPLAGPSDLPGFVYGVNRPESGLRHGEVCLTCDHARCVCEDGKAPPECRCKMCKVGTVRMETPVLYFYAPKEVRVNVEVGFPKGQVTEWYPSARQVGSGIDWGRILIAPGKRVDFPREKAESHYYPARATDAAPIRLCRNVTRKEHEWEKFLFYRGVGSFPLPVHASLKGDEVTVHNLGTDPLAQVVVFEKRDGRIRYDIFCDVRNEPIRCRLKNTYGRKALESDLEKMLVGQGLFRKEARAMIATWRDSWFEDGLRVFYLVPRKRTDAVLPLTITPRPEKLVRVLVGRAEVLTPRMESDVDAIVSRLLVCEPAERAEIERGLVPYGRFAEPLLRRVLARTDDPARRRELQALLGEKPAPEPATASSRDG